MTFSPIIATYTVDCPEHPVLPDYQPRATAACEAGVPAPLCRIKSLTLQRNALIERHAACLRRGDRAGAKAVYADLRAVTHEWMVA